MMASMVVGAAGRSVSQTADQLVFSHWHKHLSAIYDSRSATPVNMLLL